MGHCMLLRKGEKHTEPVNYKDNFADNIWEQIIDAFQKNVLPTTTLANYCCQNMFRGCTRLTKIPALRATELAGNCYAYMFEGCTRLKLSITQTGKYTQEYRIPKTGTGTTATDALTNMFTSTGGTFTGTPSINTTYYLINTNTIVG